MKDKFVPVAALLLALPCVSYSASSSGTEKSIASSMYGKSSEIKNYPKTVTDSAAGGSTEVESSGGMGNSKEDDKTRYEKQEFPDSAPGGVMGRYSSPVKKPVRNPDMGYQK